ncbi:37S ribosomal protein S9, mitochondrial [Phlyctochytrium bullatum]|nr:37S ribosomal protein S9, mitochondrial [Phlyctochytrium bullatum]
MQCLRLALRKELAAAPQLRFARANQTLAIDSPRELFNQPIGRLPARPKDIAYFTGNPKYFRALMQINDLIRKHGLPFKNPQIYSKLKTRPKWLTWDEMKELKQFKITESMHKDLVHKLNVLFTIQEQNPEIAELLSDFVKPGESLTVAKATVRTLDEFGRSYTRGSRKSARAQCWMVEGDGQVFVNGTKISSYFQTVADCERAIKPLEVADAMGSYNVWLIAEGGGHSGRQASRFVI